ncbi:HEAT repeat domain-containing protein [Tessaracoccus sp. OS52]|uniref:HEAT repeat domain-containing protein n=1 Tax=Tessaracoccus sp. OS52 TaxID=2886691 RepID=UPI001D111A69|nr:HEAT repeat domain-containing protein [Tessaracoccus sp. OS52]MCC2591925.1 HEAT repeat domain-containing protein [Tessaracoccus sp. OS52]
MPATTDQITKLHSALSHESANVRLRAALAAGTYPDAAFVEALVERCGVEPDFGVRDMLTWALIHQPHDDVLRQLRVDLHSSYAQARGQALHTLSKLKTPGTWEWLTVDHVHDTDDVVARPAWRAAVALVPDHEVEWLARELVRELGRSDYDAMRSLSRALVDLGSRTAAQLGPEGPSLVESLLEQAAATSDNLKVQAHAEATLRLHRDPTTPFSLTQSEAIDVAMGIPAS